MSDLDVIIVSWNAREELDACLASLAAQTDRDFDVIVVDNDSTDGAPDLVEARHPRVRLVRAAVNLGFGGGCNLGLAASRAPWVLLLNQDALAAPTLVAELRRAARAADPRVATLQARMELRDEPGVINSTGIVLLADGSARDRDWRAPAGSGPFAEDVFCATAGAALYRRAALDRVRLGDGPFDASHFLYYEDVDLGWRLRLAGFEARYVDSAVVRHGRATTTSRLGQARLRTLFKANRARTLLKNASLAMLARTAPRSALDAALLLRDLGPGALPRMVHASVGALRARRRVRRLSTVPRSAIERSWIVG